MHADISGADLGLLFFLFFFFLSRSFESKEQVAYLQTAAADLYDTQAPSLAEDVSARVLFTTHTSTFRCALSSQSDQGETVRRGAKGPAQEPHCEVISYCHECINQTLMLARRNL